MEKRSKGKYMQTWGFIRNHTNIFTMACYSLKSFLSLKCVIPLKQLVLFAGINIFLQS